MLFGLISFPLGAITERNYTRNRCQIHLSLLQFLLSCTSENYSRHDVEYCIDGERFIFTWISKAIESIN